jgi:hypothetical protein
MAASCPASLGKILLVFLLSSVALVGACQLTLLNPQDREASGCYAAPTSLQDDDLYSSDNYALASAMELHARITNAWDSNKDANMLPPGFKFYKGNMPQPPSGTRWQFDMQKQRWSAVYTSNGAWHSDLWDNVKYLLGIGKTACCCLQDLLAVAVACCTAACRRCACAWQGDQGYHKTCVVAQYLCLVVAAGCVIP